MEDEELEELGVTNDFMDKEYQRFDYLMACTNNGFDETSGNSVVAYRRERQQ